MLIFLAAVNERIGAGFVGKVSEIPKLPRYVRSIGIITLGYLKETEPVERLERLPIEVLVHYERWQRPCLTTVINYVLGNEWCSCAIIH